MPLVEIRVATYQRPGLLVRALESLKTQSFNDWQALVFDDSPGREGAAVVEVMNDQRLQYHPNPQRLGCAGNLDQCFQTKPYLDGRFACILEDDNWFLPRFLEDNLRSIRDNKVKIILRNGLNHIQGDHGARATKVTNKGRWYSARRYEARDLAPHLLLHSGVSNGGLFWDTSMATDLQVGPEIKHSSVHQEKLRAAQLLEPLFFEPEPLYAFTIFEHPAPVRKSALEHRMVNRGGQSLLRFLIQHFGKGIIAQARQLAVKHKLSDQLEASLIDCLLPGSLCLALGRPSSLKRAFKAVARVIRYPDPYAAYYRRRFGS